MPKQFLKNSILIAAIFMVCQAAFAATGPATVYKVKVTKFELNNGTSWITVFDGTSSALDIASVSSGQSAGTFLSGLSVPDGTYTQCRVTPAASFTIQGNVGSNYTIATNGSGGGCLVGTSSQQAECTVTASPAPSASTYDFSATPISVVNGVANHKVRVSFDVSNSLQDVTIPPDNHTELFPAEPTVTMSVQ